MHSFQALAEQFEKYFNKRQFPDQPSTLYDAAQYILQIGGKRVRPVAVLMGNELFGEIKEESFSAATAIELFHNFSLIHDDIMDKAPLRRGLETVHTKFGEPTALLSGDVMLVVAYDQLAKVPSAQLSQVLMLFNKTAKEVCEGQQLDMDFEKREVVMLDEYIHMISLKTSVLLAASFQMGAILGGTNENNQHHLYEFGKNIGIAFQIQDDYLDAFGDPEKFGKQVGGDILANKKTFLLIHALEVADDKQQFILKQLLSENASDKVAKMLSIYRECKVDEWAETMKQQYFQLAMQHLDKVEVPDERKLELKKLAHYLLQRES
jgi:geranylgeranyl diphosphate synthase type II